MSSKTNEIYTYYMHFRGFFVLQNAFAAGAPTGMGTSSAPQTPYSWWGGAARCPVSKNFTPNQHEDHTVWIHFHFFRPVT